MSWDLLFSNFFGDWNSLHCSDLVFGTFFGTFFSDLNCQFVALFADFFVLFCVITFLNEGLSVGLSVMPFSKMRQISSCPARLVLLVYHKSLMWLHLTLRWVHIDRILELRRTNLRILSGKKSKSVFDFLTYSRETWFSFSY